METSTWKPKSLESLKRLAAKIKKERGIPHADALDIAAVQAGFRNYAHANRSLAGAAAPPGYSKHDRVAAAGQELAFSEEARAAHHAQLMVELARGRVLFRDGEPAPFFHGGNDVVIAGWFVEKAGAEADARAGRPDLVYEGLSLVADEYTGDRAFAETLIMRAMHVLAGLCTPSVAEKLREYSDEKYFAYGDEFGY